MSTFLREEVGVAMSGVKWDHHQFKLWQSTRDNIILFTPKQPRLAMGANGRYQFGLSQFRQQVDGTYKITGGSSLFTITSAIQYDEREIDDLKEAWLNTMYASDHPPQVRDRNQIKFVPLNVQKGRAQVLINPVSGTPNQAHTDANIGTPGGTNSFLVELTELGAQEWAQGVREGTNIPAGVKMDYEYLRMMPDTGARVKVHGRRLFRHISGALNVSGRGLFYGGSAKIEAEWEKMVREGVVTVEFIGTGLPPELEEIRQELVSTFADQARTQLFESLFEPAPDVEPAEAGDTRGIFGGANFAFKYKREEEVTDLEQEVRFSGWTWLRASMDADLTSMIADLDESYLTEVNTQLSFPATVLVDADPVLENVAVSWTASEGKGPESPIFGTTGGNETYTVTSHNPDDVEIRHKAKVNFTPPSWPVIETSGKALVSAGGNSVVIKPASWVGRHMIFMFIEENGEIRMVDAENDYLVCNVSYDGPHLPNPIRASAKINIFEPVEFSYPLSPTGALGEAKFSAFGVVGGKLRRAEEQVINFDEEAVFILAREDEIRLVTQNTIFPENDSSVAARLQRGGFRPTVIEMTRVGNNGAAEPEMTRYGGSKGNGSGREVEGTVVAVEYEGNGAVLHLQMPGASGIRRIPVRDGALADRFDDERKQVRVRLDAQSYAERVTVNL